MQTVKKGNRIKSSFYLNRHEVQIFVIDTSLFQAETEMLGTYLNGCEKVRFERFRFKEDADHFLITRGLLRFLAGKYLNMKPGEISFYHNKYGKPFLSNNSHLQFNVSHSKHISVIAFTSYDQVGIDIEFTNPELNFKALAETTFTDEEQTLLNELSLGSIPQNFFKLWTKKEAVVKMSGNSLAAAIDHKEFLDGWYTDELFFYDINSIPGFTGTLALKNEPDKIQLIYTDNSIFHESHLELPA